MARLSAFALGLAFCLFITASAVDNATSTTQMGAAGVGGASVDPFSSFASEISSAFDPGTTSTSSSTPVASSTPTSTPAATSNAVTTSNTPSTSMPQDSSTIAITSAISSKILSNSSIASSTRTDKFSYSYNPTNFIINTTTNSAGQVVTFTSVSSAPIPTQTTQGARGHVNTRNVIIAISSIGGSAVFSAVAFAWIKLYKGRRAGWDDDELLNPGYGGSTEADPFKNTLDQYHRS